MVDMIGCLSGFLRLFGRPFEYSFEDTRNMGVVAPYESFIYSIYMLIPRMSNRASANIILRVLNALSGLKATFSVPIIHRSPFT